MSYQRLRENAREQSKALGRYAAVVTITTYMSGRTRQTVVVSTTRIESCQRGGEFVGVDCQFRRGEPIYTARPSIGEPVRTKDTIPF